MTPTPALAAHNDKPVDGAEDAARELRRIATLIRHHVERDRLTRGSHSQEWHTGMRTAANHCDERAETLERRAAMQADSTEQETAR